MLKNIYIATGIFALHSCLVLYINSSYLGQYFTNSQLSLLYIIGAFINVLLLANLPRIIGRIGLRASMLWLIAIDCFATFGLVLGGNSWLVATCFTIHQAITLMILFMFDEYLEHTSETEEYTGRVRSIYLTISSLALVISPSVAGAIASSIYGFSGVYLLSLAFLLPLFFVVWKYFKYSSANRAYIGMRKALASSIRDKSSTAILLCRFILECFYAWMVIYMALYLTQTIGFDWKAVGSMFTIMLLPFVLFQIPLGAISDKFSDEKEIIILGFIITATATLLIPFVTSTNFIVWASLLFMTRVGASFAEIGTESFFFKNVKGEDAGMISLFRSTRPISYIVTPAVATITLALITYHNIFFVLAAFVFCGSLAALMLRKPQA